VAVRAPPPCYRQALEIRRELGDRFHQAVTLAHLGDTLHAAAADDRPAARSCWPQALAIIDDLEHPDAEPLRDTLANLP
jgi:hypothetical protein